jgi:DNA-binding response OmpR family regulator
VPATILIVDDEAGWRIVLRRALESEGYRIETAADGDEALAIAWTTPPSLIILDHHMPGMDGVEVCGRLRRHKRSQHIPIIMLTVRHDTASKIDALESGADDYVTKPCDFHELRARVRARLRPRVHGASPAGSGPLTLDAERGAVVVGARRLALTRREFDLLALLVHDSTRLVSREQITREVWGSSATLDTNIVDVYIRRLRRKLQEVGCPGHIRTMWRLGYVFEPDGAESAATPDAQQSRADGEEA